MPAGIMLDDPTIALCPKLRQHNVSNLSRKGEGLGYERSGFEVQV